jgi:CHAT domain-containing protein
MLLAEYALLEHEVDIWAVWHRGWRHYTVPVGRDSVAALVDRFAREAGVAAPHPESARALLFDLLVRPLAGELRGVQALAVVPDRELNRLPFAALWDREARRYVVERFDVRTVNSAAFLLAAMSESRRAAARPSALVIGDPAVDEASAGELGRLPGAAREAEAIAALYGRAKLLTGANARRATVLPLLGTSSIFHFAGHSVFNGERPELSYLALASDGPGDTGMVPAWEIGRMRLSNLEIVVLSACSTLNPRASRTGPVAGLAYSVLLAGGPATISTLWDVSDDVTTEMLVHFHRAFARGVRAPAALRMAQLDALGSPNAATRAPRAWAAFVYSGP